MKFIKENKLILLLWLIFLLSRFYKLRNVPAWEDNFSWLYRINYYPWIIETNLKGYPEEGKDLKYAGTISYHPGVTIMTLSGISTRIGKKFLTSNNPDYVPCLYNDPTCPYLGLELLFAKIPLIILTSLSFFGILIILNNATSPNISKNKFSIFIFGMIVLVEPLLYITSRDLHLDYLQGMLVTFSFMLVLYNSDPKFRVFSGIIFGLAMLTRFASALFIPGFLILDLFKLKGFSTINVNKIKRFFANQVRFFIPGIITFVLLYPPMWVAPIATIDYLISGSLDSTTSHMDNNQKSNYLSDQLSFISSSYKEISFCWILLFLISLIIFAVKFRKDKRLLQILLFYTLYFILLGISDKKFTRYLVPVILGYSIFISNTIEMLVKKMGPDIISLINRSR